jgi:diacylglycerol kinase (ATP)
MPLYSQSNNKKVRERMPEQEKNVNLQKSRRGLTRILYATRYSVAGLSSAWHETAFRQEAILAIVLTPSALFLGTTWLERSILIGSAIAVLVVELLNTAIESALDRVGLEWHPLSKRAKDMGSAAVLLTLIWTAATWGSAIYSRLSL